MFPSLINVDFFGSTAIAHNEIDKWRTYTFHSSFIDHVIFNFIDIAIIRKKQKTQYHFPVWER